MSVILRRIDIKYLVIYQGAGHKFQWTPASWILCNLLPNCIIEMGKHYNYSSYFVQRWYDVKLFNYIYRVATPLVKDNKAIVSAF